MNATRIHEQLVELLCPVPVPLPAVGLLSRVTTVLQTFLDAHVLADLVGLFVLRTAGLDRAGNALERHLSDCHGYAVLSATGRP